MTAFLLPAIVAAGAGVPAVAFTLPMFGQARTEFIGAPWLCTTTATIATELCAKSKRHKKINGARIGDDMIGFDSSGDIERGEYKSNDGHESEEELKAITPPSAQLKEEEGNGNSNVSTPDKGQDKDEEQPLMQRPLPGGTSMLFDMIRKCMLDFTADSVDPSSGTATGPAWASPSQLPPSETADSKTDATITTTVAESASKQIKSEFDSDMAPPYYLPRWRPYKGIIDRPNPRFRTDGPAMSNEGYARTIWKNARKDKPSLWQHALRTYRKMISIEADQKQLFKEGKLNPNGDKPIIRRSNIHHEGALLACAKLGLWQQAMEIYYFVQNTQLEWEERRRKNEELSLAQPPASSGVGQASPSNVSVRRRPRVFITDNMILSLVRACVKASRKHPEGTKQVHYMNDPALHNFNQRTEMKRADRSNDPTVSEGRIGSQRELRESHELDAAETTVVETTVVEIETESLNGFQPSLQDSENEKIETAQPVQQRSHVQSLPHPDELAIMLKQQEANLRRIPLDTVVEVLSTIHEIHKIPLVALHINPIASAYQNLGFLNESRDVIETYLTDRTSGEEPEDGNETFNINDMTAKDKGSYGLLVSEGVIGGDWVQAVDALRGMTEAGLYPTERHLNIWTERSSRPLSSRASRQVPAEMGSSK